jgi:hypothetical protein
MAASSPDPDFHSPRMLGGSTHLVIVESPTADKEHMTSGIVDELAGEVAEIQTGTEYRTTELPCLICLTTMSLDDDRPKLGTVRWQLSPYFGLTRGKAISFQCPQGHSSEGDPDLLKAFPTRTF